MVEKGPPPAIYLGHDIGVGGWRKAGGAQEPRVDFVLPAFLQDALPQRVPANQAGAEQRKSHTQPGQVHQDVVRRASRALRLAANVGELFRLRININQLDLVDDPVAARENAASARDGFVFHFVRRKNAERPGS